MSCGAASFQPARRRFFSKPSVGILSWRGKVPIRHRHRPWAVVGGPRRRCRRSRRRAKPIQGPVKPFRSGTRVMTRSGTWFGEIGRANNPCCLPRRPCAVTRRGEGHPEARRQRRPRAGPVGASAWELIVLRVIHYAAGEGERKPSHKEKRHQRSITINREELFIASLAVRGLTALNAFVLGARVVRRAPPSVDSANP